MLAHSSVDDKDTSGLFINEAHQLSNVKSHLNEVFGR